jgi:hypothetical protein
MKDKSLRDASREKGEELRDQLQETADLFGRRLQEEAENARTRVKAGIRSAIEGSTRREMRRGRPPTGRPPSGHPPSTDRT